MGNICTNERNEHTYISKTYYRQSATILCFRCYSLHLNFVHLPQQYVLDNAWQDLSLSVIAHPLPLFDHRVKLSKAEHVP